MLLHPCLTRHSHVHCEHTKQNSLGPREFLKGLKQDAATVPIPEKNVVLETLAHGGTTLHFLPFLGTAANLKGAVSGDRVKFTIPQIDRGAVAWTDRRDDCAVTSQDTRA